MLTLNWTDLHCQLYGDFAWVGTVNPPRNYSASNFPQMLADAGGLNASKIYRALQANSMPGLTHSLQEKNELTPIANQTG